MNTGNLAQLFLPRRRECFGSTSLVGRAPWLHALLAIVSFCVAASAADADANAAQWETRCSAPPDDICVTSLKLGSDTEWTALVFLGESKHISDKALFIWFNSKITPLKPESSIRLIVDSKPFADLTFAGCNRTACTARAPISASAIAKLESAKSFEIQAGTTKVSSPIGNLAAARTGRNKVLDQPRQEAKSRNEGFLDEAPAARSQEGFCSALKNVIVEARTHFKSIVGKDDILRRLERMSIPGSGECEVEDRSVFSCTSKFKLRELADKQMASLAKSVGKCLPAAKATRSTDSEGSVQIVFDNKNPKIEISHTKNTVDEGYSVELSVTYY
jgi:hypothetical protein